MSDLRTQQDINQRLRLIQHFVVIGWIVRLWTKHRLRTVRCVYRCTPPSGVGRDVDVILSVVMSLISHASPLRTSRNTCAPRCFNRSTERVVVKPTHLSHRPWSFRCAVIGRKRSVTERLLDCQTVRKKIAPKAMARLRHEQCKNHQQCGIRHHKRRTGRLERRLPGPNLDPKSSQGRANHPANRIRSKATTVPPNMFVSVLFDRPQVLLETDGDLHATAFTNDDPTHQTISITAPSRFEAA
jgi:hypothetical protein